MGEKGNEFGTVTKRKRRCGWFDINLVKQSVKISGITDIVLTKLDVLDDLEFIKICVGYTLNNETYDYLPFNELEQLLAQPIYQTLSGWKESTFGITRWENLPIRAQEYIIFLEGLIDTKFLLFQQVLKEIKQLIGKIY